MSNEFEIEFGAGASTEKPKAEPKVEPKAEPKVEPKVEPKAEPQAEQAAPKAEVKPQETEKPQEAPKKAAAAFDEFDEYAPKPSILEKGENWIKAGSGMGFWLRAKAIIALPAAVILIIVIACYSSSLNNARAKYNALTETSEAQLVAHRLEVAGLRAELDSVRTSAERLQTENTRLTRQLQQRQQPQQRPQQQQQRRR